VLTINHTWISLHVIAYPPNKFFWCKNCHCITRADTERELQQGSCSGKGEDREDRYDVRKQAAVCMGQS